MKISNKINYALRAFSEDEVYEKLHNDFLVYCSTGDVNNAIELLESNLIDVNYDGGRFALVAARSGQKEILNLLQEKGADLHMNDEKPLRVAAHSGHLDCVKFLVEKCNGDITKVKGTTAYSNFKDVKEYFDNQLHQNQYYDKILKEQATAIMQTHWRFSGELELNYSETTKKLYVEVIKQLVDRYITDDNTWYGGGHYDFLPEDVRKIYDSGEWVDLSGDIKTENL